MFKNAEWIWGCQEAKSDEYFDFRLCFSAERGREYRLFLSCDTDYALYKDGNLLEFGQYPDYPDYKIYDTLSLDSVVESGINELTLTVWYQGIDTQTYVKKPAGVIFVLTEDGKPLLCSSPQIESRRSAGYQPHLCQKITSQLGLTFSYDAKAPAGSYSLSVTVKGLTKNLLPRPVKKLLLSERKAAAVVQSGGYRRMNGKNAAEQMQYAALSCRTKRTSLDGHEAITLSALPGEDGVYIILDMGRETAGIPELDFETAKACELSVGWGEHLADGRCRTSVRSFAFTYRAADGRNSFLPPFRRLGCRYLQLFFAAPSVRLFYAGIRETQYPLTVLPYDTGNLLRNRIYEVCLNTLRQCMHEHYEDCPWREQALYTLDSRNQMLCGYYAFGETEFPRACLELISHGKRQDGLLSLCFPAGLDFPIPAFSLVYFLQMREYLTHSGDLAFLKEKYPFLRELMARFLAKRGSCGLIENFTGEGNYWNFYEWSEGMSGNLGSSDSPALEAPLNAFLSLALQNLAQIAEELGEKEDAAKYRTEAKEINGALADVFFCAMDGLFRSFDNRRRKQYSVLTNSLCLLCGAADSLDKNKILTVLSENGAAETGLEVIPNTLSMNGFRFDALLRENRTVYRPLILDEIDRTYLAMLEEGATSFWETARGEADFNGAGSLCHGWTALPVFYYRTLLS